MGPLRKGVAALAVTLLLSPALVPVDARAQSEPPSTRSAAGAKVLNVPYVPQSEALCGGAAVAMVMRYWGERDIHAEDFAPYVSDSEKGIPTDTLARVARRAGWTAVPFRAADHDVRHHLSRGRPLIALVQVAPARYHYVVIIGRPDTRVLFHDPAVAPARDESVERFDRRWAATGRWAMLLLPDRRAGRDEAPRERALAGSSEDPGAPVMVGADESMEALSCPEMVERGVRFARDDEMGAAEELLVRAETVCRSPAAARELAGLRFRQGRWVEAERLARRAVDLAPEDEYGWRLLAASRFRAGDRAGALDAWNRLGEPTVDLIDINGLRRTRYRVVIDHLGIAPRDTLTREQLERAGRRLAALPTVQASAVRYRPLPDGSVTIRAAVVERPMVARGWVDLLGIAARSLPQRELVVPIASPTGAGERFEFRWRWRENRPLVGASAAAPGVLSLPGVFELGGYWERQTYSRTIAGDGLGTVVEERRHGGVELADWLSADLELSGGVGVDRWDEGPVRPSLRTGAELRLADDRLALGIGATAWPSLSGEPGFATLGLGAAWRSSVQLTPIEWDARLGFDLAGDGSPLGLWPGAGTGHAREALLRAHPILDGGVVRGDRIGRILTHASLEGTRWLWNWGLASVGVTLFADAARLWKPLAPDADPTLMVDVGTGLRLALPWRGRLRTDVAVGLHDGASALSVAWQAPWPGRLR